MAKLLKNKPCNNDLFEGKSHEHLAEVIAKHIKNDNYRGLIGIDGGWGSGKSNLVGIIEYKLNQGLTDNNKYHFFTYDAWAHQNDLPRRTILEEMIEFLTSNNKPFEGTSHWIETLDNLLAQKRETSSKTVPSLGAGIIASMACVLVSPIVNVIYQNIANQW